MDHEQAATAAYIQQARDAVDAVMAKAHAAAARIIADAREQANRVKEEARADARVLEAACRAGEAALTRAHNMLNVVAAQAEAARLECLAWEVTRDNLAAEKSNDRMIKCPNDAT